MPKRILLADDSVTIQKVIAITFADKEFDLTTVRDGNAAISRVREVSPDIVLADVSMPEKNGYQVCKEIKEDAGLHDIPVLLLAGTFEPYNEEEGKNAGVDDFILKPFESQELIDKVESLLSGSQSSEETSLDQSLPSEEPSDGFVKESSFETSSVDEVKQTAGSPEEGKDDWDISGIDDLMEVEEEAITSEEFEEEISLDEGDEEESFQLLEEEDLGGLLEDESGDELKEEVLIDADDKSSQEAGEESNDEEDLELLDELEPIEILAEVGEETSESEEVADELKIEEPDLLAKPELEDISSKGDERLDSEEGSSDFELEEHSLEEIDLGEPSLEGVLDDPAEQTAESGEVSGETELDELSTNGADLLDEPEFLEESASEEVLPVTEEETSDEQKLEEPIIEEPDLLEDSAFDEVLPEEDITEEHVSEPDVEEDILTFEAGEEQPTQVSEPAAMVLETQVKESLGEPLASEHVEQLVNKVVREVVEKVAWDIVPGLIANAIQEEIKKVKEAMSKTG